MEPFDKPFIKACKYLHDGVPFIIYKPDGCSFDLTVPYLAHKLNYNLIKVGIHDIGPQVTSTEAWYVISQVLFDSDEQTLIWIEDISVVDDKLDLINKVLPYTTKTRHFIFTGIQKYCQDLPPDFKYITWDTRYNDVLFLDKVYVTAGRCQTVLHAPQPLHFRVYAHIHEALKKHYKTVPQCVFENQLGSKSSINSILGLSLLSINTGEPVGISTILPYTQHTELVDIIKEGWTIPVSIGILKI